MAEGLRSQQPKNRLLKVVLIGDGGVGKSSLMTRFINNTFDSQAFHTIGVEFLNKEVQVRGNFFTLQIWDTAGQERFKSLRTPFYRGADCCILTFSVDNLNSFNNLSSWKCEFLHYADINDPSKFAFSVWGNKIDIPANQRLVSDEMASDWCRENGNLPYFRTSAKDDINVDKAFHGVVEKWIDIEGIYDGTFYINGKYTVDLSSRKPSKSLPCCLTN